MACSTCHVIFTPVCASCSFPAFLIHLQEDFAKIEALTKSLEEVTQKCSDLEAQLNKSQTLEELLKDKSVEIDQLKSDLKTADERLFSELAAKMQELEEAKGLNEQALAKIEASEQAFAQSLANASELQGRVDTLDEKCGHLKKDLVEKEEKHKKALESLESQMKEYLSKTEELNRQLLTKEEDLEKSRNEVEHLREDLHSQSISAQVWIHHPLVSSIVFEYGYYTRDRL